MVGYKYYQSRANTGGVGLVPNIDDVVAIHHSKNIEVLLFAQHGTINERPSLASGKLRKTNTKKGDDFDLASRRHIIVLNLQSDDDTRAVPKTV